MVTVEEHSQCNTVTFSACYLGLRYQKRFCEVALLKPLKPRWDFLRFLLEYNIPKTSISLQLQTLHKQSWCQNKANTRETLSEL